MGVRDYMIEKNTEKVNLEFNCNNYSSYTKLINEVNQKIKNKEITNIFIKIELSYIKEEV